MVSSPITSWQVDEQWKQWLTLFWGGSKITADSDCSHEKTLIPWKESYDQPRQHIRRRQWHPTPVLLEEPGGLQSMGSLRVGHD